MPDLVEAYVAQARGIRTDHWSGPPEMVDRIARATRTARSHLVVDVGCGIGGPARRLALVTGCRVVGVDVVEKLVRLAGRRPSSGRVAFVAGAAEALPVRDGAADQVWCLGSVAHVPDLDALTGEAARVLRRDGTLVVTEAFWEGREEPRFAAAAPQPWRPPTIGGLMSSAEAAGFRDVRALPWPGWGMPENVELARDIRDGVLRSHLVLARRP